MDWVVFELVRLNPSKQPTFKRAACQALGSVCVWTVHSLIWWIIICMYVFISATEIKERSYQSGSWQNWVPGADRPPKYWRSFRYQLYLFIICFCLYRRPFKNTKLKWRYFLNCDCDLQLLSGRRLFSSVTEHRLHESFVTYHHIEWL